MNLQRWAKKKKKLRSTHNFISMCNYVCSGRQSGLLNCVCVCCRKCWRMLSTQDKGLIQSLKRKHTHTHTDVTMETREWKLRRLAEDCLGGFFFFFYRLILFWRQLKERNRHWDKEKVQQRWKAERARERERGRTEEGREMCLLWSTSAVVLQIKFSTISTFLLAQKSPQQALIFSPTPSLANPLAQFLARPHSYSSSEGLIHHASWWMAAVLAF